jgi:pyruvate, water dikinase
LATLLREAGASYPQIRDLISILSRDRIEPLIGPLPDFASQRVAFTFEGLIRRTPFVTRIRELLQLLQNRLGTPVDIEFAYDGKDFYLLQCRPQSYGGDGVPAAIPQNLPPDKLIFSARHFVSNGKVPDITHIVYVDLQGYSQLPDQNAMLDIGRAIGKLNKLLPKRQFMLVGPGRWGSRGDIKLGVPVTYSDINNTAMLIEVARQKGNYLPELSFGTHFFQDLVEASIRYLPLYPDDPSTTFNDLFLRRSRNLLPDLLPEFAHLQETLRVIDVPLQTGGLKLRILMNADLQQAVGFLSPAQQDIDSFAADNATTDRAPNEHWRWRFRMAQKIAAELDAQQFGVSAFYLFGSTKNATAGPASDIDLLLHFQGTAPQRRELLLWLEGWSQCLAEINFLRTGYRADGLLDVHLITDADIEERSSFAVKINAVTDPARKLRMKNDRVS